MILAGKANYVLAVHIQYSRNGSWFSFLSHSNGSPQVRMGFSFWFFDRSISAVEAYSPLFVHILKLKLDYLAICLVFGVVNR